MFRKHKTEKKFKVVITQNVSSIFENYKQIKADSVEACGILIGKHSEDGRRITLDFATPPSLNDRRKKYSFKIDSQYHQKVLNQQFYESQNESVYLGTWHSHPEPIPSPSRCDINDWKKQYEKNKCLFDKMIFIIVGESATRYWLINNGEISEIKKECIRYENY